MIKYLFLNKTLKLQYVFIYFFSKVQFWSTTNVLSHVFATIESLVSYANTLITSLMRKGGDD